MESEAAIDFDRAKPMPLVLALLLSLPLFGVGYVIVQTIRWTNHLDGFMSGLIHLVFFSVGAAIYLIPWALIVHFSFRKRANQRRRTLWMLGPSVLMCLLSLSSLATNPPTAEQRFRRFAKTELPGGISDLRTNFSGGGLADYGDTYYFKTSSAEIDRLIREMELEEDKYYSQQKSPYSIIKVLPDSPDYRKWVGAKKFTAWDDRKRWFYHLITDATKTQVYVFVGCI
jgi:hypothetical protein